jgi:hypothetical protein
VHWVVPRARDRTRWTERMAPRAGLGDILCVRFGNLERKRSLMATNIMLAANRQFHSIPLRFIGKLTMSCRFDYTPLLGAEHGCQILQILQVPILWFGKISVSASPLA